MLSSMEKSRVALSQLANFSDIKRSSTHSQSKKKYAYDTNHERMTELPTENTPHLKEEPFEIDKAYDMPFKAQGKSPVGVDPQRSEEGDDNLMHFDDLAQVRRAVTDELAIEDQQESSRFSYYGTNHSILGSNLDEVSKKGSSHWNKEVASVAANMSEHMNPTKSLQAQVFNVADSARRSAIFNQSLKVLPQKQSRRFSYSSSGYIWEGMRYSRAQGPVSRVCIMHGPPLKVHYLL